MTFKPSTGWQDRLIEPMPPAIDLGAFIGRFQFATEGHRDAIRQGLTRVKNLAILLGSSFQPRTYFNPFSFEEREEMILGMLTPEERERVRCYPLEDSTYNNNAWIMNVQERVEEARQDFGLPEDIRIGLVGHKKDGTSFYLNMFPMWEEVAVRNTTQLSATPLRELYFLRGGEEAFPEGAVSAEVAAWLQRFMFDKADEYDRVRDEYLHVEEYRKAFAAVDTSLVPQSWLKHRWVQKLLGLLRAKPKYPPIFVTVDSCVVQSGHILMVKRKQMPGKGLWALPGGFLEASERIEDGIYRELREETALEVPEAILRGRTEEIRVFDAVHRSSRGRTITHCALINLQTPPRKSGERVSLPRFKGNKEETFNVKWFPLAGPGSLHSDQVFEDHYQIIKALTAKL